MNRDRSDASLFAGQEKVAIIPHQGLGDLIVSLGLIVAASKQSTRVVVVIPKKNQLTMSRLLGHLKNVSLIVLPAFLKRGKIFNFERRAIDLVDFCLRLRGFKSVPLGWRGANYLTGECGVRFDEDFYRQAGVPFEYRWKLFPKLESTAQTQLVAELLAPKSRNYIFLHEDESRGFVVDRSLIRDDLAIVQPSLDPARFALVDYLDVLRGAVEIHCIESSFAALIDSIEELPVPKFAHRYARPEASSDPAFEFSYRQDWTILL